MSIKRTLAQYQDKQRNKGWRFKEICWRPEGELEVIRPKTLWIHFMVLGGIAAFLGGMWLAVTQGHIYLLLTGLGFVVMVLSILMQAKQAYGHFEPVEAECLERKILYCREGYSAGDDSRTGAWEPRLLCRYRRGGEECTVTSMIPKVWRSRSKRGCDRFLENVSSMADVVCGWIQITRYIRVFTENR